MTLIRVPYEIERSHIHRSPKTGNIIRCPADCEREINVIRMVRLDENGKRIPEVPGV